MKLLIVTAKMRPRDRIFSHFNRLGYDIIVYDNPLKAMDNLSEVAPDAVLFNAEDFPRHWKPFLQVLRQLFDRESSVFIILKGGLFDSEEAVKAGSLSVNGVISEDFTSEEEIIQLENILSRYLVHDDSRGPDDFLRVNTAMSSSFSIILRISPLSPGACQMYRSTVSELPLITLIIPQVFAKVPISRLLYSFR